jgi:hypothetical protein
LFEERQTRKFSERRKTLSRKRERASGINVCQKVFSHLIFFFTINELRLKKKKKYIKKLKAAYMWSVF